MLLTAETGKQVMACREDRRNGKEGERREGLGEKERFKEEERKKKRKLEGGGVPLLPHRRNSLGS